MPLLRYHIHGGEGGGFCPVPKDRAEANGQKGGHEQGQGKRCDGDIVWAFKSKSERRVSSTDKLLVCDVPRGRLIVCHKFADTKSHLHVHQEYVTQ